MVSTQPYLPNDTLALTLEGKKAFPRRPTLIKFVRQVTGKTKRASELLLDQARAGVETAMSEAEEQGKRDSSAARQAPLALGTSGVITL
jgi:hypothetical protein